MFKIAVGHSIDPDSLEAVNEVIEQCQVTLAGELPQAGLLFCAIDFEHQLILDRLNQVFPNIALIGGTSDGEISSLLEFQQDSITLMLFCADEIEFVAAVGRDISKDPIAIAKQFSQDALCQLTLSPQLCIAIPESLTASASSILQGLKSGLHNLPIVGGASADRMNEVQRTYQFFKTEVLNDAVPILLFAGKLLFSHGVASGWNPIGKRSVVTKAEANIVYEIDGKPALDFYHYYLNDFIPDSAYPLAVFPPGQDKFFLRGSHGHDPILGSIAFSGDIPLNSEVQVADAALENILTASKSSFANALTSYSGSQPLAAIFFSCAWRRHIMGTRTNEEYKAIEHSLDLPLLTCGFYTYGEIAPLQDRGETFFHNTTFVTLLIGSQ